jgi:hypothetical protein
MSVKIVLSTLYTHISFQDFNCVRLRMYARYIRVLYLNTEPRLLPPSTLVRACPVLENQRPLLPNLHTLHWTYPSGLLNIQYLVHSGITLLTITLPKLPESNFHIARLSEAIATMHRLNSLHIMLESTDLLDFWQDDIDRFKQNLVHLESFVISV